MTEQEKKYLTSVFVNIKIFPPFKQDDMEKIFNYFSKVNYPKETLIIKEGTYNDSLYIIYKGKVLIYRKKLGLFKKDIKILKAGDFFGEISIYEDVKTTASVKTLEDSEFFVLPKNEFRKLIDKRQEFRKKIQETIEKRKKDLVL